MPLRSPMKKGMVLYKGSEDSCQPNSSVFQFVKERFRRFMGPALSPNPK